MNKRDILKVATKLQSKGNKMAANAIDMAVKEARDENIGILNVIYKFANWLDSDGHHETVDELDVLIRNAAQAVSSEYYNHLYDHKSHREQTLFQALEDEAGAATEPDMENLRGGGHPLLTRYSPDYPGVMMQRIADGVYQDLLSKKVYDFRTGFISDTGQRYHGGSVANQTPTSMNYKNSPQVLESKHLRIRPR